MEFIRRNVNGSSSTSTGGSGGGYSSVSGGNGKLETHTIFSLPFDGTNDVKGDLADVDKITADGDISTGGNLIIKGKDDDDAYNGKDLNISLDGESAKFEGGNDYTFDKVVYAPIFVGDVDAENVEADNLDATVGSFREITTEKATVMDTLTTTDLIATLAEISKIISGTIEVDNLTVKKAAHFFKLIIDEIKSVGGLLIISPANATFDKVVVSDGNYKCYFRAVEGDKKIDNQFEEKDLVVCQTFNASEGLNYDASNKFYWRLVIDKGTEELDGIDYHYIILSDADKDADSNGVPTEGDKVALLGNRTDTSRQNAIIISAYSSAFLDSGITAPFIVQYSGINNYNLSTHRNSIISNGKNLFTGDFVLTSGEDVGGLISEIKATAKDISLFVLEPENINMFEGSNGNNCGCWKVSGVSVSTKSGTNYILVLGGSNSGGYILQPSKYYVTTNKVNVSLEVSELLGLSSYYSMEICDESGTVISNKVNLATGTKSYAFTLTKVPNSIVHLKISLVAGSRLAFRNEKALLETVPKRISGIEVDIDSITSRVSGTEGLISTINQTVSQINSKVTGMEGNISQIAQKADSIESTVANILVGGTNLINDSEFGTYSDSSNGTWTKKGASASTSFGYMNQIGIHAISNPTNSATYGYLDIAQQSLKYKLKANTNYTFSFYAKGFNGTGTDNGSSFNYKGRITTYVYPNVGAAIADNAHTFTLTDKWERYSYTFKTVDALDVGANHSCLFRLIRSVENGTTYYSNAYICMPKIEEGTMATAWDTTDADMKSYITQKADLIESKIVTEDTINSKISQSKTSIKAEVYDEMNKATGINVSNGSITLNADKTTVKGNLNITDTQYGITVYETATYNNKSTLIPRINLLPKQIESITNIANDTYDFYSSSLSKDNPTSWSVTFGNKDIVCSKDDTVTFDTFSLNETSYNSGGAYSPPTASTCRIALKMYSVVNSTTTLLSTKEITLLKFDNAGTYKTTSSVRFPITADGTYRFIASSVLSGSIASGYTTLSAFVSIRVQKAARAITYVGTDGMYCHSGANKYFYVNENETIIQHGFNGIKWGNKDISGNKAMMVVAGTTGSVPNVKPVWYPFYNFTPVFTPSSYANTRIVNDGNSYSRYAYKINPLKDNGICYLANAFYNDNFEPVESWVLLPPSYFLDEDGNNCRLPVGYTVTVLNGGFGNSKFNAYVSANVDTSYKAVFVDGHRDKNWKVSLNNEVHWERFVYMGSYYSSDCNDNLDIWMTLGDAQ